MDRLLDEARTGPLYLRQAPLAEMMAQGIHHNASALDHYSLHAFVVMANQMLARNGRFWQEESYDHQVRNDQEFERIRRYIEENPVRAGLVREPAEFPWSSAREAARGPLADQGVRPTGKD